MPTKAKTVVNYCFKYKKHKWHLKCLTGPSKSRHWKEECNWFHLGSSAFGEKKSTISWFIQ